MEIDFAMRHLQSKYGEIDFHMAKSISYIYGEIDLPYGVMAKS